LPIPVSLRTAVRTHFEEKEERRKIVYPLMGRRKKKRGSRERVVEKGRDGVSHTSN